MRTEVSSGTVLLSRCARGHFYAKAFVSYTSGQIHIRAVITKSMKKSWWLSPFFPTMFVYRDTAAGLVERFKFLQLVPLAQG